MPAWSLSGSVLLMFAAPVASNARPAVFKAFSPAKASDARDRLAYRLPPGGVATVTDDALSVRARASTHSPRYDRAMAPVRAVITEPGAECVRSLLRDRMAKAAGPLDARVQWKLTGSGSDLGLTGGLKRVFDGLLHE